MTSYIPEGWGTMSPYLVMKNAAAAIDFYVAAFDAEILSRMNMPDGGVGHAELQIGNSKFMLADEFPDQGYLGPESIGGTPVSFMLYVQNVDAVFARAVAAGATALRPVEDQFYGDRVGSVKDPAGHIWSIATHIEDVPSDEIDRRFREMMSGQ
ncbi:MAG: VOC family protein [Bacteroidia bacterium]|nr:VOC family protein [Bacteroidia bacterium]